MQMRWNSSALAMELCLFSIKPSMEDFSHHIHGLMQMRSNSSALAMELRLFSIKPSVYGIQFIVTFASEISTKF